MIYSGGNPDKIRETERDGVERFSSSIGKSVNLRDQRGITNSLS